MRTDESGRLRLTSAANAFLLAKRTSTGRVAVPRVAGGDPLSTWSASARATVFGATPAVHLTV